jgi:hypothetical protein
MGGTIQQMKAAGWDWTLIAMCVDRPERQKYYDRCCGSLGVRGIRMDFFGEGQENNREYMEAKSI